ncbi:MAG: sirohydrochlorin cobaltochelatase [bacterium]
MTGQAVIFALAGTSSDEATASLRRMEATFDARFGPTRMLWAFTSSGVRRKLEKAGKPVDDPAGALDRLRQAGIPDVAVKSLHLAPGMEYKALSDLVQERRGEFRQIALSDPLLATPADFERTVRILLASVPRDLKSAALLLVAHGSRQTAARAAYEDAAKLCRGLDRLVMIGSLMPPPGPDDIIAECKAAGVEDVLLAPLMIAAGFSARTEITGDDPGSWASALRRAGIRCVPVTKGLADYDDIVRIWLEDVQEMLARPMARNDRR